MAEDIRPKALMIPLDKIPLLELLEPEQFKRVVVAMGKYIADETTPEGFAPIETMAFESLRPFMNENIKTYQKAIEAHRAAGKRGGRPKKNQMVSGETEENQMVSGENQKKQSTKYKVQSTKITDTNVSNIEANASKGEAEKKTDVFTDFANGDGELLEALKDFEEMRKRIKKPMTDKAKKLICNKLKSDYSPADWIAALNQSIENSWQGLYPLKDKQPVQSNQAGGYDAGAVIEAALKNIDRKYGI